MKPLQGLQGPCDLTLAYLLSDKTHSSFSLLSFYLLECIVYCTALWGECAGSLSLSSSTTCAVVPSLSFQGTMAGDKLLPAWISSHTHF